MKIFFILLLPLITACNSSYFTTANNMRNIPGKVYLVKGGILEGDISVNNEGGFNSREYIRVKEKGKKEEKIPFQDIREISVRNEFYLPKKLEQTGFLTNPDRLFLVKRLTVPGSRIQFYEYLNIKNNTNTDNNGNVYPNENRHYQYYISLPGMGIFETYDIERRNVVPDFENKVSAFVKDCKVLAEKIKKKEKGYFYAQISLNADKRIDTWLRIIEEYNACK
jgi:hypothetical protein